MKDRKTRFNWLVAAVVVLAVAGTAYYLAFMAPTPMQARAASFEKESEEKSNATFITYADSERGFSLSHPVGYFVSAFTVDGERVVAVYADRGGGSEAVQFEALNQQLSASEISKVKDSFEAGEVQLFSTTAINGKPATLLNTFIEDEGSALYTRQAFVDCEGTNGIYTVVITASIPDGLSPDVPLADYMISSFRCAA